MREFWRGVVHVLEEGAPVELVSILSASGSTPRGAGALMAVLADGRSFGTIGGGNVEYTAQKTALELLERGEDGLREFRFVPGDAASLGMVCGGDVTVQFQYLPAGDQRALTVLRELVTAFGGSADTWLVRRVENGRVTAMACADRCGTARTPWPLPEGLLQSRSVFLGGWSALPAVRAGKVYICGGGHVSRALVPAIAAVGFRPVVYDDRPEFADPALFPAAEALLCGPFSDFSRQVPVSGDDYVVIMTRGHQADYEVLTQVLRSPARYLGCIGSRRKLALCRERLEAAGFTAKEYGRLHAPIGLDIGAETPEEIAVSVAAELIAVRAGKLK